MRNRCLPNTPCKIYKRRVKLQMGGNLIQHSKPLNLKPATT